MSHTEITPCSPRWHSSIRDDDGRLVLSPWPRPRYPEKRIPESIPGDPGCASIHQIVSIDTEEFERTVIPDPGVSRCFDVPGFGRQGVVAKRYWVPCGQWTCRRCAMQKVGYHLGHLHDVLRSLPAIETVFVAMLGQPPSEGHVRALRRAETSWGVPAFYCIARRADGVSFVLSEVAPGGEMGRLGAAMSPADAFEVFRDLALALPGIARVPSYRRGRKPPIPDDGQGLTPYFRPNNSRGVGPLEQFVERLDERALEDHGRWFSQLPPAQMDAVAERVANDPDDGWI